MAITGPTLVNGTWFDVANLGVYDTSAGTNTYTVQLVAGRRYFMLVENYSSGAQEYPDTVVHDPAGTPLSFSLVTDGTTDTKLELSATTGVISLWQVNVTTTTGTALIRIDPPATQSVCAAILFYISGEDDSGTIVKVVKATGTGTAPAVTMNAFGATDNLLLLCVVRDDLVGFTETEGRSELAENHETERNWFTVHYQNPNGGDTTVGCTLNVSDLWGAIGIEIKSGGNAQTIPAVSIGVPVLTRFVKRFRAPAAVAIGVPVLTRISKRFRAPAAVAIGIPTIVATAKHFKTLAAVVIGISTMMTILQHTVTIAAVAIGVPVLAAKALYKKTLAAIAVGVAVLGTLFIPGEGGGSGFMALFKRRRR